MVIEVAYFEDTMRVRGWCADPKQFGGFKLGPGQAVKIISQDIRDVPEGRDYYLEGDLLVPHTLPVVKPDYKAQYKAATNQGQRIAIIAKMLKLEDE